MGIRFHLTRQTHLFYVASFLPPDGGAKQLSQRGNAELFFGSGAVSLDSFQTQIQISGNFRRRAALAEQLKNFQFAVTQTFYRCPGSRWPDEASLKAILLTIRSLT